MKLLVIGMDGVDANDFRRGWTPFIESLLNRGTHVPLKEDLISRGWSEIILGETAETTGAFYDRPIAEGHYEWTDKFRIVDVPGIGSRVRPVWQALNEKGYRTGIMNVPTTFPASEVDGFFVSGGGGGGPVSQQVVADQCHPTEIKGELAGHDYILDERIGSLLFDKVSTDSKTFFGRLGEMASRRTDAFLQLVSSHPVDFSLVVYRSETMVSETLGKPIQSTGSSNTTCNSMKAALRDFYGELDRNVRRLVEAHPEAEVLLVSDHGTATRRYSVNLNAFLRDKGYQQAPEKSRNLYRLLTRARHWVPKAWRAKLKKKRGIARSYAAVAPFKLGSAKAFNNTRRNEIHGIFINDERRFGGVVRQEEMSSLAARIVDDFNRDPRAEEHGVVARLNDAHQGPFSHLYPDVLVEMPDGYLPSNSGQSFIEPYEVTDNACDLQRMRGDEKNCIKSHHPLCVLVGSSGDVPNIAGPRNLTWVYRYIESRFQPGNGAGD